MKKEEWRQDTWIQLSKDFNFSGNSIGPTEASDLDQLFQVLTRAIRLAKSNKAKWDNLNYRIDIPQQINIENIEIEQVAYIFLLRSFQKVWTRKHFDKFD